MWCNALREVCRSFFRPVEKAEAGPQCKGEVGSELTDVEGRVMHNDNLSSVQSI